MTLRPSQLETLRLIAKQEPQGLSIYRLANAVGLSRSTAGARLRRLRGAGLVYQVSWRRYRLTPAGEEELRRDQ